MFCNPELKQIIRFAYEKKIKLFAVNGVNLNMISDEIIESLIKYQFQKIRVSIDGATQETYEKYRIGGDINKVFMNINKINSLKKMSNSKYPILEWQYIIFGHNEHEIPLAKKLAEQYKMEFIPKLNWDETFSPVIDQEFVKKILPEINTINLPKDASLYCKILMDLNDFIVP